MKVRQRIANIIAPTSTNSAMGADIARRFFRFGPRRPMIQDWSQVVMTDQDMYTGYMYASIRNRANGVAQLATNNLKTDAAKQITETAKKNDTEVIHPYLDIIDSSPTFSNHKLWTDISTYLDLRGVYYLLVIRAVGSKDDGTTRVGNVQEFKLLNPYEIQRVFRKGTFELGGYTQNHKGFTRDIPPEMIIEIRELNPFDDDTPLGLSAAARDSQFTLKQAGDYTRHSLKNNMAAPGVLSTDVVLPDEQFDNFVSRVTNQEKGLPIFGNGKGSITWSDMQIQLDKSALKDVSQIHLESMLAVTGMSKTTLGIEQSGVTRDTAKVMKDQLTSAQLTPRLQLIIDALNQDYKNYSTKEYKTNEYRIYIDSPLGIDRAAEIQDVTIRSESLDLYNALVNKGYERDLAAKYATGEIGLEDLGEPTNEPIALPGDPTQPGSPPPGTNPRIKSPDDSVAGTDKSTDVGAPSDASPGTANSKLDHRHTHELPAIRNQLDQAAQQTITQQESVLKNSVINIEHQVVSAVLSKVTKNEFTSQNDVINPEDRKRILSELALAIAGFYSVVMPLNASSVMNRRAKEFQLLGSFKLDNEAKQYIKLIASRAAGSHMDTILGDILDKVRSTEERLVQGELKKIAPTGNQTSEAVLAEARRKALEGPGRERLASAVRQEYNDTISKVRATTIARTETSRAFNRSQFEADRQFLAQNNLTARAYKKWVTRSDNPCPFCIEKANEAPIPFDDNFALVGDVLKATFEKDDGTASVRQMQVAFEDVGSGNLHPNCACTYQLIIE